MRSKKLSSIFLCVVMITTAFAVAVPANVNPKEQGPEDKVSPLKPDKSSGTTEGNTQSIFPDIQWTSLNGPPGGMVKHGGSGESYPFGQDPNHPDNLYVACDRGLYKSVNKGEN